MEEESKNLLPTVDVPDFVDEEEDEEYDVDYKPSERLKWAESKRDEYNVQRKKNKVKNREMEI